MRCASGRLKGGQAHDSSGVMHDVYFFCGVDGLPAHCFVVLHTDPPATFLLLLTIFRNVTALVQPLRRHEQHMQTPDTKYQLQAG